MDKPVLMNFYLALVDPNYFTTLKQEVGMLTPQPGKTEPYKKKFLKINGRTHRFCQGKSPNSVPRGTLYRNNKPLPVSKGEI